MSRTRTFVVIACLGACLASAGCALSPQAREAKYLDRGKQQMKKKDSSRAALEFRNAVEAMPKDAEAHYQLGLAYLGASDPRQAAASFKRATELNPKHFGAQLKLAELMASTRNKKLLEQAAGTLESIIAASGDNIEAIDALAETKLELGKPEDAAKLLEEALQKVPSHLLASVNLARLKLAQNDFAAAEEILKKAVANAPQSAAAAVALGDFYISRSQFDKAEPEIQKALQLDPKSAPALAALGIVYLKNGRTAEAGETYKRLSALPGNGYQTSYATFLYRTGKVPEAIAELQRICKADPDNRENRGVLLALYRRLDRMHEAEELVATALKRNPKDTEALFQRSTLYLKAGRITEAAQDLRQILTMRPDSAEAHYGLAAVLHAQGFQKAEMDELSAVLRLRPDMLQARMIVARNLLLAGQPDAAMDVLDKAPGQQKNSVAVVSSRIWAWLEAGDYGRARAGLEQALSVTRTPELVLQEAVLKLQQKDYAAARLDAEEVLRKDPTDVRAARIVASAYVGQRDEGKALRRLIEIVEFRPKSAPLRKLLGEWYLATGKLPEARNEFVAARDLDPASGADLALAELDIREKQFEAARLRLKALIAVNPRNVAALLLLANAERLAGNRTGEIAIYRQVLAGDGSNLVALNNLAYELAFDQPDEALKIALLAAGAAPNDATVLDTMGWVYYRKGVYVSAVDYLKTAVEKEPTARRQFHLAMAYIKAGQREAGQNLLLAAVQRDPTLTKTEQGW